MKYYYTAQVLFWKYDEKILDYEQKASRVLNSLKIVFAYSCIRNLEMWEKII